MLLAVADQRDDLSNITASFADTVVASDNDARSHQAEKDAPSLTLDLGDFYWADKEKIRLHRQSDELVVAFKPHANTILATARLLGTSGALKGHVRMREVADGIVVFRGASATSEDTYSALATDADVAWTSPVLINADTGRWVIPTNQVAVKLGEGIQPRDLFGPEFTTFEPLFVQQWIGTLKSGGGLAAIEMANRLANDARVEWATPNSYQDWQLETHDPPDDPLYGSQWHLNNTGQNGARVDADSDIAEAWDTTTGDNDLVIAVLDGGIQTNHPDLNIFVNAGEIAGNGQDDDANGFVDDVNGWDFRAVPQDNNPNPNPLDTADNHGTAVAGVGAARGDNALGVTGTSQSIRVLPIKIADGFGFALESVIAKAVYYAAGAVVDANNNVLRRWRGADILNCSWGGGSPNTLLTAAFDWATTGGRNGLGAATLVASGNDADGTNTSPAYKPFTWSFAPGNWIFKWRYVKDAMTTLGDDFAWLANIRFPNGATERFETLALPAGWSTTGNAVWQVLDDPAHTYGTGRYVARSGDIGDSQDTRLRSPTINVAATGNLTYNAWVSSQATFDELQLWSSTDGGQNFNQVTALDSSGVPTVIQPVAYPANLASVIAVGASTDWDYRSAYSQFGTALDIVAPSNGGYGGITTTDRTGTDGYNTAAGAAGDYTSTPASAFGGTSAAAPYTAGTAALLLAKNPVLTAQQIRTALTSKTDKIGGNNGAVTYDGNGFNQYYGFGRLNSKESVESVWSDTTIPIVYSRTPAAGTVTNIPSPLSVDVEFSEPVVGVDVSDLVVSGAGASVASVGLAPLLNPNTYRFVVNAPNNGTINLTLAPDAGDITDFLGQSVAPLSWTYTIDRSVAQPTAPDLAAASDTGRSSLDNVTSVTAPTFVGAAGSVPANATVQLFEGATLRGTTTATGTGSWSITTGTLGSGAHTMYIIVNGGPGSPTVTVTVDTTAPSASTAPDLETGSDTGPSSTDNITSDNTPTFRQSSGPANSIIELFEGTTLLGWTISSPSFGSWSITTGKLSDGVHPVFFRVIDAAGNVSANSPSLSVTIDTTGPRVNPVIVGSSNPLSLHADWTVPSGSGQQIATIPVARANEIKIVFSDDMATTGAGALGISDLTMTRASASGTDVSLSNFNWNPATKTATVNFAAAGTDYAKGQFVITLSDSVTNVAGLALDGEWTNPTSVGQGSGSSSYPSGNTVAGGAFSFYITLLPGDVNRDNWVTNGDVAAMMAHWGQQSGAGWTDGDMTGEGAVGNDDSYIIQINLNTDYRNWGGMMMMSGGGGGGDDSTLGGVLPPDSASESTDSAFRRAVLDYLATDHPLSAEAVDEILKWLDENAPG